MGDWVQTRQKGFAGEVQKESRDSLPIAGSVCWLIFLSNVKVMAHPLAVANDDRGIGVEIRWEHRKLRG